MAHIPPSKAEIARADAKRILARDVRAQQIIDSPEMPSTDELREGYPPHGNDLVACIRFWAKHELRGDDLNDVQRQAFKDVVDHPSLLTMRDLIAACASSIDWYRRCEYYLAMQGDIEQRDRFVADVLVANDFDWYHDVQRRAFALGMVALGRTFPLKDDTISRINDVGMRALSLLMIHHSRWAAAETLLEDVSVGADDDDDNGVPTAQSVIDGFMSDAFAEGKTSVGAVKAPAALVVVPVSPTDGIGASATQRQIIAGFSGVRGQALPYVLRGDVASAAVDLKVRFPHFADVVDHLAMDTIHSEALAFRPTLFVGSPGCGKTSFARAVAEEFRLPVSVYALGGMSDSSLMGTSAQWSSARPSVVLQLIRDSKRPNPVMVWDELEKTSTSHNGSAVDALLALLEPSQAAHYRDLALERDVDLSAVIHFATANGLDGIPAPLLDRFRIVKMPDPEWQHVGDLARGIIDDIAKKRGVDRRWIEPLAQDELDLAIRPSWSGGSIRRLRKAIGVLLDGRDAAMARA